MNYVSYEDFKSMDMRLGLIRYVEPIEGADKLLRFEIDFGPAQARTVSCNGACIPAIEDCDDCEDGHACTIHCSCEPTPLSLPFDKEEYAGRDIRQIVSGINEFFTDFKSLEGRYGLYILNLEPREIRGVMSHGMLMAVDGKDGNPVFLGPQGEVDPGTKVR